MLPAKLNIPKQEKTMKILNHMPGKMSSVNQTELEYMKTYRT